MARLKDRFQAVADGSAALAFDPTKSDRPQLMMLAVEQVEPDPDQPRRDLGDLSELKASIREHGIVQPIIVSPASAAGLFRIIAGERRYTAAKELGQAEIPCVVRSIEEHRRLEVQLIENIHRKGFNPIEEATAYKRLMDEFKLSQRQLADRLGKSVATVNQTLRILTLPEDVLEGVQTSERLSRSVLLEIAKQETPEEQRAMWKRANSGGLTVKSARAAKPAAVEGEEGMDVAQRKGASRVSFRTTGALVTVSFAEGDKAKAEVVAALTEALAEAKRRV